ncbi:response regulator transcription factor [Lederbergia lenta]|uniref:Two-component response regulator YesM n=1 Tax=Lederbergia lenta TaxID=1467 RepID=A0A2X4VQF8_LEDLE|nr:response regulator transcription factor [Lederbergia lenta]MEC2326578.1 response regulator transcription factor [Lederbergia lenta]SQI53141.1 two-component response regulator YesM [Lederbergia lenta]
MYSVLLVDDERIILDGISSFIQWEKIGASLIGTAKNGLEAFRIIEEQQPDIVISDIKMPGMNGLELVEKTYAIYPDIQFIMLSGFGEFDYAKQAMQYGVKHYLLKPCNEQMIINALKEMMEEIALKKNNRQFISEMKDRLDHVLPYAKEQLLKEFVTRDMYGSYDLEYYEKIFRLEMKDSRVKLLLIQLEGNFDFEHMFAIKNISEQLFEHIILSCTVEDYVLIVIEDSNEENIHLQIETIRETFFKYYQLDTTIAISESGKWIHIKKLYKEALECLQHRFYLGEGTIIRKADITYSADDNQIVLNYDEQRFCLLVKSGRWDDANKELMEFFKQLVELRMEIYTTKSYVIQLFNAMIRICSAEQMKIYLVYISQLLEMETIQQMESFIIKIAKEITLQFYERNKYTHSAIIQKVLQTVEEQIGNPELSLNYVAQEELYMSADYLGKLFKKEVGERFSNYVSKVRMERAMHMIQNENDVKVFELAEKLGYSDSQYFSQVFKKHTGFTPSDYRKELFPGGLSRINGQ